MALKGYQQSFRGFEYYASKGGSQGVDDSNSPLDVRIRNNIQKISHNDSELKGIAENIGTKFDSRELRDRLKTRLGETNELCEVTKDILKEYSKACPKDTKQQRQWKVQQSRYNDMFRDVLKDYQETQKALRVKERITLRESLVSSGISDVHFDESGGAVNEEGQQIQIDTIKEEENLELIKERGEELKQLERDIVDINSMFKDISGMIHEQGEEIDKIEENVEVAVTNVEEGVKDLEVAADLTSKSRRRTLGLVLIVFIVIAVVVTIILAVTL